MVITIQSARATFASFGVAITIALAVPLGTVRHSWANNDASAGAVSGLPIPRFVSLKAGRVNVRTGPNKDQDVRWVYTRAAMPIEITAEFENWRRIRDWEGAEGWVYHSMLSGKRTIIVVPRVKKDLVPLYRSKETDSAVVARLEAGVLAYIKSCDGQWCQITGENFSGWIQQDRVWGAYPNEKVDQ
jgi:SH3-like domain-containing protein